jgi:hypothetical protein
LPLVILNTLKLKIVKIILFIMAMVTIVLFSECGVNSALILNHNQNTTQVVLSSNNYKVIDKVTGTSNVKYICMIGGLNKKQLYEKAYSDTVTKANLLSSSKALINIVTEEHFGGVPPFFYRRTVVISANVIEFIK